MDVNQDKILNWLKHKHQEAIEKTSKAQSYLMEGFYEGRTNLAYELMIKIKRGDFR
jgi:hypothetical protein